MMELTRPDVRGCVGVHEESGLDSRAAVLRGALGVSCSPKPSISGAECLLKGAEFPWYAVGTW